VDGRVVRDQQFGRFTPGIRDGTRSRASHPVITPPGLTALGSPQPPGSGSELYPALGGAPHGRAGRLN
jgi:hypothetical protein